MAIDPGFEQGDVGEAGQAADGAVDGARGGAAVGAGEEVVGEEVGLGVGLHAGADRIPGLEDRKRARQIALTMGTGYHTSLVFRYLDTFPRPAGVPPWPQLIPDPTPEQLDERIAAGQRVVGDPDECAKAVQLYADIGCDQLIFGVLASTQPQEVALESVALFGKEVQPRFDKDPVHSTTRMREAALRTARRQSGGGRRETGAGYRLVVDLDRRSARDGESLHRSRTASAPAPSSSPAPFTA